jgi:hypothetical protein
MKKPAPLLAAGLLLLTPALAYAEPGVSGSHMPFLLLIVITGTAFSAYLPFFLKKRGNINLEGWVLWVVSIVLGLVFLVIIGPIIIAFGSILMTGRTM